MYCNMMFTVATYLVEQVSGLSFVEFLHKHFFGPLSMDTTHLQPDAAIAAGLQDRIATPYIWRDVSAYTSIELEQCPEAQGAGSIFTSANDYIKWVRAVMNQEHPVSPELYKGLMKPRIFENPEKDVDELAPLTSPTFYAAGWELYYYRGYKVVNHDGMIGGFGGTHFFLPQLKFGAVIFGNAGVANDVATIISHELIDEVLNVPQCERPDWNELQKKDLEEYERDKEDLRKELCPETDGTEPQKLPLNAYTGKYQNAGYHEMTVIVKDDKLLIDATDRSMGFNLAFEHVCDQTKYIAHLSDYYEGSDEELAAEFKFENDKVVKMGIRLEEDLKELIWFDRVESSEPSIIQDAKGLTLGHHFGTRSGARDEL